MATNLEPTSTLTSLYGVDVSKPKYGGSESREFVLEGVRGAVEPLMQQQHTALSKRGFGGRFYSPTIEAQAIKPVVGQAAEATRKALTDLYYKDEDLALQKRKMAVEEGMYKLQKRAANEQYEGGSGVGTVLCTELFRQGLLPYKHIFSDYKFLKRHTDKETHENYLRWAVPLAKKMHDSKLLTYIIYPFIRLWSGYMRAVVNKQPAPISGLIIHKIGVLYGKLYKSWYQKKIGIKMVEVS